MTENKTPADKSIGKLVDEATGRVLAAMRSAFDESDLASLPPLERAHAAHRNIQNGVCRKFDNLFFHKAALEKIGKSDFFSGNTQQAFAQVSAEIREQANYKKYSPKLLGMIEAGLQAMAQELEANYVEPPAYGSSKANIR